jgi:hypothetical protein
MIMPLHLAELEFTDWLEKKLGPPGEEPYPARTSPREISFVFSGSTFTIIVRQEPMPRNEYTRTNPLKANL